MIYRRIHTDRKFWFCVYRSDPTGDCVLYAALKEKDWPEVAMRLTADEVEMFRERPADFLAFARDFIDSHDCSIFSPRKIRFRCNGPDILEIE